MGNLLRAEFRKTTTTGLWWGLLIPTVLLAFVWALGAGAFGKLLLGLAGTGNIEALADIIGVTPDQWQMSLFGIARSINIATVFPMIFGGLAISNEINRRTITTTFLTAPSRGATLAAKMLVYVMWGAVYGVAIVMSIAAGVSLSAGPGQLPELSGWLVLGVSGVVSSILMTMFGVGVGALIGNVVGTTAVLLVYMVMVENGLHLFLSMAGWQPVIGFLPNGSINGVTGSVAVDLFMSKAGVVPDELQAMLKLLAGANGAFNWWLSGLVFLVWTAAAFVGGWLAMDRKDIT